MRWWHRLAAWWADRRHPRMSAAWRRDWARRTAQAPEEDR